MANIEGIPVYNALIEDEEEGMLRVSLVDYPAVLSDFQKFKEDKKPMMFSVKDEEKRLVYGVLMRADFPIYRNDNGREYYIIFKADTIRLMAEKYLLEKRQNNVNIMHEEGTDVDGVQMVQLFIKDENMGVAPEGFADIADGSLFAEYHVTNDKVWDDVKSGVFKGFSLEGYFRLEQETDDAYVSEVTKDLDGKFNETKNEKKMKVKDKIAEFVKEANKVMFGSMTTDNGVLSWEGEDALKVGDKVDVVSTDEEGNEVRTPAPDGEYIADGYKYIVAEGVVTEIIEVVNEAEEEEAAKETEAEAEEEVANEDVAKLREDVDALRKEMDEAFKLIDKLLEVAGLTRDEADTEEDNFSKMSKRVEEMSAVLESIKKTPVAEPAHSAFEKVEKKSQNMTMAQRCAEALRK